jgi:hypothetical protein
VIVRRFLAVLLLASIAVVVPAASVSAASAVVTNCSNDSELRADLTGLQGSGGGSLTFACGTATIALSGGTLPMITTTISISGGNTITLDGTHGTRLFDVASGGHLTLVDIALKNGYFNGKGGAISNAGQLSLNNVDIRNSHAPIGGAAIATTGGVDIQGSTFSKNKSNNGGAIFADTGTAVMTILGSSFHDNEGTGVSSGADDGWGGAIYLTNGAAATIRNTDVYANTSFGGAGIAASGAGTSLNLIDSKVRDNIATKYWSGGIFNRGGATTEITNSTISGNTGKVAGGIYNAGSTVNVTDSTLSGNHEQAGGYGGGGLTSYGGTVSLTNVTVSNNTAGGGGAGIENAFGAVATLTNVTISGNVNADSGGEGGGFHNFKATAYLINVTVAGNDAGIGPGGGLFNSDQADTHMHLTNVVVANSVAGGNCAFGTAIETNVTNMSSDATCGFGAGSDSRAVLLGALANNGGPTLTHRPQAISPLVDAGTAVAGLGLHDQRGVLRPQGSSFDIGAVEVEPITVQSNDPYVRFDGWRGLRNNGASGGSYRQSRTTGDSVTFTFSGNRVRWITRAGPNVGKARVAIDGVNKCTCDPYASPDYYMREYVFSGLGGGKHTIKITVTGKKNPKSKGKYVAVDGFRVGNSTSVIQDTSTRVRYNDWVGVASTDASGGEYRVNGTAGSSARLRFNGPEVTFVTALGPTYGMVNVLIDGVVMSSNVDLYTATQHWLYPLSYNGLTIGTHTIEIRPTGTKNASSSGFGVVVDAFTGRIDALPSR